MNRNKYYISPQAYYALRLNDFTMELHSHSRLEIMYVTKGEVYIEIDNRMLSLPSHHFILINANISHRLIVDSNNENILLNLEFSLDSRPSSIDLTPLFDEKVNMKQLISPFEYYLRKDNSKLEYALKDLIEELENCHQDNYLLGILSQRMLIELLNSINSTNASGVIYVKKAVEFIQEHFAEDLNVAIIAKYSGVNHTYLQILFRKSFGCGVMAYVNRYRMERATFLLKNSNLSITEIAFELGYNSRQHFGYTFTKHYNVSPRDYRTINEKIIDSNTEAFKKIH
ncbi:MAG: AraC family transcriptional regulator [Lachnospiraceae bacterium]